VFLFLVKMGNVQFTCVRLVSYEDMRTFGDDMLETIALVSCRLFQLLNIKDVCIPNGLYLTDKMYEMLRDVETIEIKTEEFVRLSEFPKLKKIIGYNANRVAFGFNKQLNVRSINMGDVSSLDLDRLPNLTNIQVKRYTKNYICDNALLTRPNLRYVEIHDFINLNQTTKTIKRLAKKIILNKKCEYKIGFDEEAQMIVDSVFAKESKKYLWRCYKKGTWAKPLPVELLNKIFSYI